MQDYSLYILGRSGRLVREIEVECANEIAAIDLAQQWVNGYDVELWQLDRMIARFSRVRQPQFTNNQKAGQPATLSA
jgi:hypothetical protein